MYISLPSMAESPRYLAGVVELVDTPDLGSGAYGLGVRVPPPALLWIYSPYVFPFNLGVASNRCLKPSWILRCVFRKFPLQNAKDASGDRKMA